MPIRSLPAAAVFACVLLGADRKPIIAEGANDQVAVRAVAYLDKNAIKDLLGADLGGSVAVVEVSLTPKTAQGLKVFRDDFQLHSYKDGQKSGPFAPSQIAGSGVLVVSTTGAGGGIMADESGPIYGGIGGGRPRRMGADGGVFGNAASQGHLEATMHEGGPEKQSPLLKTLKEKSLSEKETVEPVRGLLYFPLEGKHKAKDLSLVYRGQGGKLVLEFRQ